VTSSATNGKGSQEIGSKNKISKMNIKPAHDTTIECNVATSIQLYDREASNHEFLGKQDVIFVDKGTKIPYNKFFFRP
jgi:hypothetical protein